MIENTLRILNILFASSVPYTHIGGYLAGLASMFFAYKYFKYFKEEKIFLLILGFIAYSAILVIFSKAPNIGIGALAGYFSHWLVPFYLGYTASRLKTVKISFFTLYYVFLALLFFSVLSYMGFLPHKIYENFYLVEDGLLKALRSHIALAAICQLLGYISIGFSLFNNELTSRAKKMYMFLGMFFFGALFITGSRGYYISVIISIIAFAVYMSVKYKRRNISLVILACLITVSVFGYFASPSIRQRLRDTSIKSDNVQERLLLYKVALYEISQRPLFGFGPGQGIKQVEYFNILPESKRDVKRHPHLHSFYLNLAADTGITGLIFFGIIVFVIIKRIYYIFNHNTGFIKALSFGLFWGIIGVLLGEMFDALLRGPGVAMEVFWISGLLIGYKGDDK